MAKGKGRKSGKKRGRKAGKGLQAWQRFIDGRIRAGRTRKQAMSDWKNGKRKSAGRKKARGGKKTKSYRKGHSKSAHRGGKKGHKKGRARKNLYAGLSKSERRRLKIAQHKLIRAAQKERRAKEAGNRKAAAAAKAAKKAAATTVAKIEGGSVADAYASTLRGGDYTSAAPITDSHGTQLGFRGIVSGDKGRKKKGKKRGKKGSKKGHKKHAAARRAKAARKNRKKHGKKHGKKYGKRKSAGRKSTSRGRKGARKSKKHGKRARKGRKGNASALKEYHAFQRLVRKKHPKGIGKREKKKLWAKYKKGDRKLRP